jgi:hypothetical protein
MIPDFIAKDPISLGPFDRYWLAELVISMPQIGGEASVSALFAPYRNDDGVITSPPLPPARLTASNLFASANEDPELALAIEVIGRAVLKLGVSQDLLVSPE